MKPLFITILLLSARLLIAQNSLWSAESTLEQLNKYSLRHLQEKVYLVTDKPFYAQGDTIWFQTFLVNAIAHQPFTLSNTVYVELIDNKNEILESRQLLVREGIAPGDFVIKEKQTPGLYRLRAYTNWMQNFPSEFMYCKEFEILNVWPQEEESSKPSASVTSGSKGIGMSAYLQFFPEGGQAVRGFASLFGIKSYVNEQPAAVKGSIIDPANGAAVANFTTDDYGIGGAYIPDPSKTYQVKIDSPAVKVEYQWPQVLPGSFGLKVFNRYKSRVIQVMLETDIPGGLENSYLIGHTRGEVFLSLKITGIGDTPRKMLAIDAATIPSGVSHITFFDASGLPRAERLFFIDKGDQNIQPEVSFGNTHHGKREKVTAELVLSDTLSGFTTVSVTNSQAVIREKWAENINSYLLLTSDLTDKIDDPGRFFQGDDKAAFQTLDYLMLTHGWRRFNWEDIRYHVDDEIKHVAEAGMTISGELRNFTVRKNTETGWVQLMAMSLKNKSFLEGFDLRTQYTDSLGHFMFNKLYFNDSIKVILQSKKAEKSVGNRFFIDLKQRTIPSIKPFEKERIIDNSFFEEFVKKSNEQFVIDRSYGEKVIMLEAVSVEAKVENPIQEAVRGRYTSPDYRLMADSVIGPKTRLLDLLMQIPSVMVDGYGIPKIRNTPVTLYFDGFEMDQSMAQDIIQSTAGDDIYFIDIDKSGFSNAKGNPIIYVYTKSGNGIVLKNDDSVTQGLLQFILPGYAQAHEFFVPAYDQPSEKPDHRVLLFWSPDIRIQEGKAQFEFFTGDVSAPFDVIIEGMTKDGKTVTAKKQIIVK